MDILIKAKAGSHLFGTNTENSDIDYKGIFIPSVEEILTGEYKDTVSLTTGKNDSKNTKDDIDVEMYSVRKFLKMILDGDTAAIELLHTPKEMIIESSPHWDFYKEEWKKLINKEVKSMIGYIRSQVNKYGIRGSRMSDLTIFLKELKRLDKQNPHMKMKVAWEDIETFIKTNELKHISVITLSNGTRAINVLGKCFEDHAKFEYVCKQLSTTLDTYGYRTKEALENKGIDWKAVSHALRCCIQAEELLTTGKITLPHSGENLDAIMNMKLGKVDFSYVDVELNRRLEVIEELYNNSTLTSPNKDLYLKLLKTVHLNKIKGISV